MERERSFKKKLPLKRSSDTRLQGGDKSQDSDLSNLHWSLNNPNLEGTGADKQGSPMPHITYESHIIPRSRFLQCSNRFCESSI